MRRFLSRFTRRIGGGVCAAGVIAAALPFGALCGSTAHAGQPELVNPGPAGADLDPAEAQARWMESMQLGAHHEWLGYFIGEWDAVMRIHGMGPEPMESAATAVYSWELPGRWLAQRFEGSVMGQPMQGFGLQGYDKLREQYVGSWMDTMSTGMLTQSGKLDDSGRVLTQFGTMDEPLTGEVGKTYKYVTRIEDADRFMFRIQDVFNGEPVTVLEIEYRRKGEGAEAGVDESAFIGEWEFDTDEMAIVLDRVKDELLAQQRAEGVMTEEQLEMFEESIVTNLVDRLDESTFTLTIEPGGGLVFAGTLFGSEIPGSDGSWRFEDGKLLITDYDGESLTGRMIGGRLRVRADDPGEAPAEFEMVLKRVGSASGIDAYLGSWTIDEPATRAALIKAFDADRGEEGSFADEFGGTSEELADYFLASVRATLTFADDGTYRVVSSAPAWQRGDEVRPWEFRGDHAILDAGEPNPARLQVKHGKMHLTPLDEPGMPEGLVIILERARGG